MPKLLRRLWIPAAAFSFAAVLAFFAGPSLGNSIRSSQATTGKRYYCVKRCEPGGECTETQESDTPIDGWECEESFPVNFNTGFNAFSQNDLEAPGLSHFFTKRMYVQDPTSTDHGLGPNWRVGWLYRAVLSGTTVSIISGNDPVSSFTDNQNGTYTADFNYVHTLTADSVNHLLVLTDAKGKQWKFFDFSGNWNAARQGRLKEFDDRGGNITTTTYGTSGVTTDKLLEVQQTDTNPNLFYRFTFAYNLSGASVGLLASITYSQTNTGVTKTVRVANYTYYTSGGTHGPAGTLRKVVITDGTNAIDTSYYRYNAADAGGFVPLRYALQPRGYDRLIAALTVSLGHAPSDTEVDATADSTIATYAEFFFVYDANRRVTQETVQGQGCGCGSSGSRGIFSYAYATNPSLTPDGPNVWRYKTTVTLPNGHLRIVYTNSVGQTMLDVFKDSVTAQQWCRYYVFNSDNSLAALAFPSAVTGFTEGTDGLVSSAQLPDATGLWHLIDYYATTNLGIGAVAKYVQNKKIRQGEFGTPILSDTFTYTSRTGAAGTIYPLASSTKYRNTDGTGSQVTTFTYNSWQGTSTQFAQRTTAFPSVSTAQNGSGSATTVVVQADVFGRVTSMTDGDGFTHTATYDTLTGAMTQLAADTATLNLITTYRVDLLGRTTKATDPLGQSTYTVYNDPAHQCRMYPGWTGTTTTGPTLMVREDRPGSYREILSMSATPHVTTGEPDGTEAVGNLQSLTRHYTDTGSRVIYTDSYFNLSGLAYSTAVNIGTQGTHFYRRSFNYDVEGHKDRDVDWTGTIRRTFYDSRDRVQSAWIGTNDTPASGDWSPTNNTAPSNMIKVASREYDSGGVGNGNLTKASVFTAAATSLDTLYLYDFRDRSTDSRGADKVATRWTYDNLDQLIMAQTYADADSNFTIGATELRGKSETKFDDRGRVYQTINYEVNPTTGAVGLDLPTNVWYNSRGLTVKRSNYAGLFQKTTYDGAGRPTAYFTSFQNDETLFADAFNVINDTVVEETIPTYDAVGNVLYTTRYQSPQGNGGTGDLATGWTTAKARRTFSATWYDLANRVTTVADYGTNGDVSFTRPGTAPAPNGSANILVTKYEYDAGGRQHKITDNLAKLSQTTFDGLGRQTRVVQNFVNGVAAETELDTDQITDTVYDSSGRLSQRIAYNPKGTGQGVQSQITTYVYATIANVASPAVYRNDILVAEIYPDSDDTYTPGNPAGSQLGNGTDGVYDRVQYTYDYASRRVTIKDQRAAVRTMTYDAQGRLQSDAATTVPSGVDSSVLRIEYGFDDISRVQTVSSYDAVSAGNVLNQMKYTFDGYGRPKVVEQAHVGSVIVGTPSSQLASLNGAFLDGRKSIRPNFVTYPNGRQVGTGITYDFNEHTEQLDLIWDMGSGTYYANYITLGQHTLVKVQHPQVTGGLTLDYGALTGSPAGWDRFGRVIDQKWGSDADAAKFERLQHTYDNTSMRLTSDRTYTGAPTNRDEQYTYDGLHRLTNMKRGTLANGTISNKNSTLIHDWTGLDALGNWRSWRTSAGGSANPPFNTQARAHNSANEIDVDNDDSNAAGASITQTGGSGMDWVDPQYDKSGNMKNGPKPGDEVTAASRQHHTYDAWNRLVKVQADSSGSPGTAIAEYQYDGLRNRIVKLKPNGANWDRVDYYYSVPSHYYSMLPQVWEERAATALANKTTVATVPKYQWIWDLRHPDAPILRDENKDGDNDCVDGTDERLFFVNDVNFNTTALVNLSGTVVERYAYDPYGRASVFNASWTAQASTVYNNEMLFAGYRLDPETALYRARNRAYHPTLGRFLQRDPADYVDGMNLYEYVRSNPIGFIDPLGLGLECGGTFPQDGHGSSFTATREGFPAAKRRAKLRAIANAEENAEENCKALGCPGATVSATIDEYYRFFRQTVLITPRDGGEQYMTERFIVTCDVTMTAHCPPKPKESDPDKSKPADKDKTIEVPVDVVKPVEIPQPPPQPPPPTPPSEPGTLRKIWEWLKRSAMEPRRPCNPNETDVDRIRREFGGPKAPTQPPRPPEVPSNPGPR